MRTTPPGFSLKKRIVEKPERVSRGRIFDSLRRHVLLHVYAMGQNKNQTILQRSGLFKHSMPRMASVFEEARQPPQGLPMEHALGVQVHR